MVCRRCKMIVARELENAGLYVSSIELGVAEVPEFLSAEKRKEVHLSLLAWGLELVADRKTILAERIKHVIIEQVHFSTEPLTVNLSHFLSGKLNYDYTYLANLFSDVYGTTIEKYMIAEKIEFAKKLIAVNDLNLTEIADRLHYGSVSHLSAQFKKVTGHTPSFYKQVMIK